MAPIYLGKRVVPSSLRYIENLAKKSEESQLHNQVFFNSIAGKLCVKCLDKFSLAMHDFI